MRIITRSLVVVAALLLVGVSGAFADTISSTLDTGNTALAGITGPFGTVSVDLTSSTTAMITFTAASGFLSGASSAADANINATSWAISALTGTALSGFSGPTLSDGGSGNVDGFGVINQTLNEFDGFTSALSSISFTVTNTGGTWASAANVLTANASGFDAAAHIFVCGNADNSAPGDCVASNGAFVTVFAAESAMTTPEPSSLLLLGAGALSLLRLRKKATSVA